MCQARGLWDQQQDQQFPLVALAQASISVTKDMASNNQYATEIARLHRTAAESRLRSVESQLSLAFTLCAIAETEIRYSRPDEAIKLIERLRHHAETIRIHLDEPNHLPKIAIPDLRNELTKLTKRTEEIESSLRQRRLT